MASHVTKKLDLDEAAIVALGATAPDPAQQGRTGSACAGRVYISSDTKRLYFGADDGSVIGPYVTEANSGPSFFDAFKDDTDASQGGVPINGYYTLRNDNNYGLPGGMSKKRTE